MKTRSSIASVLLVVVLFLASWAWATGPFRGMSSAQGEAPEGVPVPAALNVEPAQLPAGAGGPGNYIQFDEPTHNLDAAHGYPITGGHTRFGWDSIEPNYDDDYRFDELVLPWVEQEANRGKKVAIGFVTYNGRQYGGTTVPSWLWARDPNVRLYNNVYVDSQRPAGYVLNYLNRTYVTEYKEMIQAFAWWVASKPTVRNALAWVETGTGLFGENQPTAKSWIDSLDREYYMKAAPKPGGAGWGATEWINHVNEVNDFYRTAFNNAGLGTIPVFTNIAPTFVAAWERDVISDHAAGVNVGLKHAGLLADHNNAIDSYAPIVKWYNSGTKVPINWEVYGPDTTFGPGENEWYWTVLAGLEWHPDYFLPTRGVVTFATHRPSTEIAQRYSGVTLSTTPDVWVALRETFRTGIWDKPIPGNFEFWLYQNDYDQGRTVTETNRSDVITQGVTNRLGLPVYNPNLGTGKEGWTTRRTNQGDGNPYMWFRIDDGYIYGGPTAATIQVTYFDMGTDRWSLRYDSTSGLKDAVPTGSANAWVQKTNTRTWKVATFSIADGRFQNNMPGSHDMRIDCLGDGNEWIHMVKVSKGSGPVPPTPTPTTSPSPTPTTPAGSAQVQLRQGPNLISYSGQAKPVAEALASISGKYTKVYSAVYEFVGGKYTLVWKQYIVGAPPFINTLTQLEPWKGYWVYVNQDCIWTTGP